MSKIYENQPNRNWIPDTRGEQSNGSLSLHQKQAAELTRNIWTAVRGNDDSGKNNWNNGWSNLNYLISGERGSGKSTFLDYVTRCITKKVSPFSALDTAPAGEHPIIKTLFYCDPTAMASNEDFFVSIIAALKDWLKSQTQKSAPAHDSYLQQDTYAPQKQRHFIEQINHLARGIRQINRGSSAAQEELDPVSQLGVGMSNSSSALKLKRDFDELINGIASAYKLHAFLIAIDDADIEFTKNKRIIEIIRTYLTHPRLVILFTGDTVLTHEAIREKQFSQLKLPFHHADIANQKRRWELTDAMTAQYLKKIFPPSNQCHLTSLRDTIEKNRNCVFKIGYHQHVDSEKEELMSFLERLFTQTIDKD